MRGEADAVLEHYGYARAGAQGTLLHVDLGRLSSDAGAGAFALTDGPDRLITAAGAPSPALAAIDPALSTWREALLRPAAAATLDAAGHGAAALDREDSRAGTLLAMVRSGAEGGHKRRLFLEADGAALLGEDQARMPGAVYRFPLHPGVEARGGTEGRATLVLRSGRSWRFESAAAKLTIEDGVYAGAGTPRPSRQLVLTAEREGVRWALRRV
nr:heparinase II/III family protein [Parvularcula dongshanensis]